MAEHERVKHRRQDEVDNKSHSNKNRFQLLHHEIKAAEECTLPIVDKYFFPSLEKHALFLTDTCSDEERTNLTIQLQQYYGNAHVQRLIERIGVEKGSQQPLETETRLRMRAGSGKGLSDVRISADATDSKSAKDPSATAFTSDKDVFFRNGNNKPSSLPQRPGATSASAMRIAKTQSVADAFAGDKDASLEAKAEIVGTIACQKTSAPATGLSPVGQINSILSQNRQRFDFLKELPSTASAYPGSVEKCQDNQEIGSKVSDRAG